MRAKIKQLKEMLRQAEEACKRNPNDAYYTGRWAALQDAVRVLEAK